MSGSVRMNIRPPIHFSQEFQQGIQETEEAIRLARGLTPGQQQDKLNILKILYFLLLLLGLLLASYSGYIWQFTNSQALLVVVATSLILAADSLLGIIGCFVTIKEIKFRHLIMKGQKTGYGHDIMLSSFYFMIIVFVMFLVFGTRVLFYNESSISYFEALYNTDPEAFAEKYYDKPLQQVLVWGLLMINLAGYICYIILLVIAVITYLIFQLSTSYEAIHSVLELINVCLLTLGLAVIALVRYVFNYREDLELQAMIDKHYLQAILVIAVLIVATSLLGYFTARRESESLMKVYIGLCGVLICLCGVGVGVSISGGRNFYSDMSENCMDFLALINQDYISTLGCSLKYLEINQIEEELQCEKQEIRYIWEKQEQNQYGCLNKGCCATLATESKSRIDYISICCVSALFLISISLVGCYFLYRKLKKVGLKPAWHRADNRILLLIVFLLVSAGFYTAFGMPELPILPPYRYAKVSVKNGTLLDQRYLSDGFFIGIKPLNITESCSNCQFNLVLKSEDGVFHYEDLEGGQINITGHSIKDLNKALSKSYFEELCQAKSAEFSKKLYLGEDQMQEIIRFIETERYENGESSLEYKGGAEGGNVIKVSQQGCLIEKNYTGTDFAIDLPLADFSLPYKAKIEIESSDNQPLIQYQRIGGFPFTGYKWPSLLFISSQEQFSLKFHSIDVLTKENLNSTIIIRQDWGNQEGPFLANLTSQDEISLPSGTYSLTALSTDYKPYQINFQLFENMTLPLVFTENNLKKEQLRVLLTWKGEVDLDIRANFILDNEYHCDVSYSNKQCGGVKLLASSDTGNSGQLLSFYPIGAYQYLVYIKKFVKSDFQMESFTEYTPKLDIYTRYSSEPIFSMYFGQAEEGDQVLLGFCIDGKAGISSLYPVQQSVSEFVSVCQLVYGEPEIYNSTYTEKIKVEPLTPQAPPNFISRSMIRKQF